MFKCYYFIFGNLKGISITHQPDNILPFVDDFWSKNCLQTEIKLYELKQKCINFIFYDQISYIGRCEGIPRL